MSDIRDFRIDIGAAALEDLHRRLEMTRFPEAETTADWNQGVPLAYAREIRDYFIPDFSDWKDYDAFE